MFKPGCVFPFLTDLSAVFSCLWLVTHVHLLQSCSPDSSLNVRSRDRAYLSVQLSRVSPGCGYLFVPSMLPAYIFAAACGWLGPSALLVYSKRVSLLFKSVVRGRCCHSRPFHRTLRNHESTSSHLILPSNGRAQGRISNQQVICRLPEYFFYDERGLARFSYFLKNVLYARIFVF